MTSVGLGRPLMHVRLLEADPDLARSLPASERARATRHIVVSAFPLPAGGWIPPARQDPHQLGFLVLNGLLARDELVHGPGARELLGPGDVIVPWREQPDECLLPRSASWHVLEQATLANLDCRFEQAASRYPSVWLALFRRAAGQSARLSTDKAICQLTGVDTKLLALFWHLAERFGKVTAEGVLLPLRLHHQALGQLIGARRSTVTLALQRLVAARQIELQPGGGWILTGEPDGTPASAAAPHLPQTAGDGRMPAHSGAHRR